MKTETIVEECLILAHRINKLGGCVLVWEHGHVNRINIELKESKANHTKNLVVADFVKYKANEVGNKELTYMLGELKKLYQELKEIEKL